MLPGFIEWEFILIMLTFTLLLEIGWLKPSIICYELSINRIKSLGLSVKPACVSQKSNVKVFPETHFNEEER